MINIGGNRNDIHYRYKREIISVKYESRNGIQTRLMNIDIISKQIKVPKDAILTNFKKHLARSITENVIKGKVEVSEIEEKLELFIKKYVLCPKCYLPEWNRKTCNACGHVKKIKMKHEEVEIESESETDNITSELDMKLNKLMYQLYDYRDSIKYKVDNKTNMNNVNKLLDLCWKCEDEDSFSKIKNMLKILK